MLKPQDIINAFDHAIIYIYGQRYARDNPHKSDLETAERWIEEGLDLITAAFVFYDRMIWMHEKHLRDRSGDRTHVPASLKLFDDNITNAIRRANGDEVTDFERQISQWRARMIGFQKNPAFWRADMWGPPPDHPDTRMPKQIINECKKRAA
jgi:hypothetical protein